MTLCREAQNRRPDSLAIIIVTNSKSNMLAPPNEEIESSELTVVVNLQIHHHNISTRLKKAKQRTGADHSIA